MTLLEQNKRAAELFSAGHLEAAAGAWEQPVRQPTPGEAPRGPAPRGALGILGARAEVIVTARGAQQRRDHDRDRESSRHRKRLSESPANADGRRRSYHLHALIGVRIVYPQQRDARGQGHDAGGRDDAAEHAAPARLIATGRSR